MLLLPVYFPRDMTKVRMTHITKQHEGLGGSHIGGYEEIYLLGCDAVESVVLLLSLFFNPED
jgi:hypothetical protein